MPVLAYCISEAGIGLDAVPNGVVGARVESFTGPGLQCFFSELDKAEALTEQPARQAAMEFYRVLQEVFRQGAIIPFRFPTVVSDNSELRRHLQEHAAEYQNALERLREMVQMEIRITAREPVPSKEGVSSGKEYLSRRRDRAQELETAAEKFRQAGKTWIHEWRQRPTQQGIRCFALVHRDFQRNFMERARSETIPAIFAMRVSGPWPATEFIKEV
jgi:hypothetical protein